MFTYIAPLVFVLTVTMCKEAFDDYMRMKRDKEMNNTVFPVLNQQSEFQDVKSQDIKVGMIIKVKQN